MLLGKALVEAGVITETQLQQALKAKVRYPNLSLAEIITKLFSVPLEVVATHYIERSIIPCIKEWLQRQMDAKTFSDGLTVGSTIADIAITVPAFTRHEGEAVSFQRNADGQYQESSSLTRIERILATIDPLVITTTKQQKIILSDVQLEVILKDNIVRPDTPGFLSELKIRLLKAFKEKA